MRNKLKLLALLITLIAITIYLGSCSFERSSTGKLRIAKPYGKGCVSSRFIGY